MKQTITAILFSLFATHTLPAQSPYTSSWSKDGWIGGTAFVVALTASAVDDSLKPLTAAEISNLSRNDVNWFDRSATNSYSLDLSKASDVLLGVCLAAPLALLTDGTINDDWGTVTVMYLETLTFATFMPSYTKGSVDRFRPYVYHPDAPLDRKLDGESRRSFFSGHATLAFASATLFATIYSDYYPDSEAKPYVWGGSLLAAGTVGYLRYASGAHFPTDVLVGAVVGSAIGYLIPYLHRADNENDDLSLSLNGSRVSLAIQF